MKHIKILNFKKEYVYNFMYKMIYYFTIINYLMEYLMFNMVI